jgi:hypothetical protein
MVLKKIPLREGEERPYNELSFVKGDAADLIDRYGITDVDKEDCSLARASVTAVLLISHRQ